MVETVYLNFAPIQGAFLLTMSVECVWSIQLPGPDKVHLPYKHQ